jgi:hypothetical protein
VFVQLLGVAVIPLNLSVPCTDPKFVPATVTDAPMRAESGEILLILGAGTVKLNPLLEVPLPEFTTTFPLLTSAGTDAVMLVSLQAETAAVTPLNVTLPVPCVAPKFVPLMTTAVPAVAVEGAIAVMAGTGSGVDVTVSLDVLNLSVTLCLFPAVFCSKRIPMNRSVLAVVIAVVALQLKVLTAVVLKTVLIVPTWHLEAMRDPVELTCAKQTSEIRMFALVVVLSTARV